MESECPSCHKKIEHEDFLFEVQCPHCKCRFNPFMAIGEGAGLDGLGGSGEPTAMEGGATTAATPAESETMFQEIRDYGENLGTPNETPISPPAGDAPAVAPKAGGTPPKTASYAPLGEADECPMTAADGMQGFVVEAYFSPLSAMCELEAGAGNPMKAAFDQISAQAKSMGANAVLSVRWLLSPDGSKVVVTGTPVRCTKQ